MSLLKCFMIDFLNEASNLLEDQKEIVVVSDNAKVQQEQATPAHPILETLGWSESFRELIEVNGGNTRWDGGGGNSSFRVAVPLAHPADSSTSSSTAATSDSSTAHSEGVSVPISPAASGSASGAKKVGRWESSTPSPAARSRNAGAGLSFPRRLPDHTDSLQIISKSVRRKGIRIPSSLCWLPPEGGPINAPNVQHNNDNETLDGSMPSLAGFLDDLDGKRCDSPQPPGDPNLEVNYCPSSPGSTLSRQERNQLTFAAMAFQAVQRRFSAESAAATEDRLFESSPQKKVQRCSSMPITASALSRKSLHPPLGSRTAFCDTLQLTARTTLHPSTLPSQPCDGIARFASDISAASSFEHKRSVPPTPPIRRSVLLLDAVDEPYQNVAIGRHDACLATPPSSKVLRRACSDTLEFRTTSEYYYTPQLQRLKEDEQQEMGKIERRRVVDNSLTLFGQTRTPAKSRGKKSQSKLASISEKNMRKHVHDRWIMEKRKSKVLDEILVHDRWIVEKRKSKVLEEILVRRKPSLIKS